MSQYQKVHFAIVWIFWCKMKITQADAPTIRMDCHHIQTTWCTHLYHPHHCCAGCPSSHNPPILSWLGTGAKYAGLHTQWLGLTEDNDGGCKTVVVVLLGVVRCTFSWHCVHVQSNSIIFADIMNCEISDGYSKQSCY